MPNRFIAARPPDRRSEYSAPTPSRPAASPTAYASRRRCRRELITTAGWWGRNSSSRWGQMELSFSERPAATRARHGPRCAGDATGHRDCRGHLAGPAPKTRTQHRERVRPLAGAALRRVLNQAARYILGLFGPDSDLRRWGCAPRSRGPATRRSAPSLRSRGDWRCCCSRSGRAARSASRCATSVSDPALHRSTCRGLR